jgi:gliding motility-associated protein GldM
MSGAKNCPETPRQKMIAMMYLVLTAMLALNVSADILKGFKMVNNGLITSIQSADERNRTLMISFEDLHKRYPDKIAEWLTKAKDVETAADDLYGYINHFKYEIIKIADGNIEIPKENLAALEKTFGKATVDAIKQQNPDTVKKYIDLCVVRKDDNLDAAGEYAKVKGQGKVLKEKIDSYRDYIKFVFDDKPEKNAEYDRMFSTASVIGTDKKPLNWVDANFESMPLAAVVTMLSKYQSDVRQAQTEAIQYLKNQTDAGDFRVNEVEAVVIPESKTVVAGGAYKAQIMLAARDTNAAPKFYINGNQIGEDGIYTVGVGNSIGQKTFTGHIELKDPVTGEAKTYSIKKGNEYSVVAPSATIANQDMNVVYMGYDNRMSISVPGFSSDKVTAIASNASLERNSSGLYICRPKNYDNVIISVTVNVEGKNVSMGQQAFRVRTLPNPTIFLRFKNAQGNQVLYNPEVSSGESKLIRANLLNADVVAEYSDGLLQASFKVQNFTLSISDGRGGFTPSYSDGNNFSAAQKTSLQKLKAGSKIFLEKIKVTGAKTVTLSYPPFDLP